MFELTVISQFEAAHCLPGYPGKCARLHGHNWTIEVCVGSETLNELGMVIDFKVLKKQVSNVTDKMDHHYLNELDEWQFKLPTAEHIAQYVFRELQKSLSAEIPGIRLLYVKTWESASSAVLYRED